MTIKEFSLLCSCTTQTLRYYDSINLLKPARVDQFSGYRYYDSEQALDYVKIKNLQSEKESNSRQSIGDLGVRVQSGGMPSDTTAKKAIRNVLTRDALINCDFSGNVLEGVDRAEMYIRDAYILRDMRKDYNLFNSQLGILGTEQDMFLRYIRKEATLGVLAEERGISYETVQQKMVKIKNRLKQQVVGFMEGNLGGIA